MRCKPVSVNSYPHQCYSVNVYCSVQFYIYWHYIILSVILSFFGCKTLYFHNIFIKNYVVAHVGHAKN